MILRVFSPPTVAEVAKTFGDFLRPKPLAGSATRKKSRGELLGRVTPWLIIRSKERIYIENEKRSKPIFHRMDMSFLWIRIASLRTLFGG